MLLQKVLRQHSFTRNAAEKHVTAAARCNRPSCFCWSQLRDMQRGFERWDKHHESRTRLERASYVGEDCSVCSIVGLEQDVDTAPEIGRFWHRKGHGQVCLCEINVGKTSLSRSARARPHNGAHRTIQEALGEIDAKDVCEPTRKRRKVPATKMWP